MDCLATRGGVRNMASVEADTHFNRLPSIQDRVYYHLSKPPHRSIHVKCLIYTVPLYIYTGFVFVPSLTNGIRFFVKEPRITLINESAVAEV